MKKSKISKAKYLSSLLLAGTLMSCTEDVVSDENAPEKNVITHLISADSVNNIPLDALKDFAKYAGQPEITKLVRYGVNTFKIVYQTTYNDKPVEASGLIYAPQDLQGAAPLVSLQHGTTFLKDHAPSTGGEFTGMEYFAAAGYVAIMPDYLGYGVSSELFHPYYDEKHSASTVIDLIKSAKEFLVKKNISFNDDLFLAGYSEGGYVTLAAAKELENNPSHNLTVKAVAAGAGGYDLEEMLASVTTKPQYSYPAYLAFVLMSYNKTYNWNKPLTYFFQDKYAQALESTMNGQYDGWQINSKLTTDVAAFLNPEFYQRLKQEDGELELKKALTENSVSGWKSTVPTRLYHGTKDEIIPYQNSERTLANFKELGSTDISLTLIPGASHGSAFVPMLKQFVPWFESLRAK